MLVAGIRKEENSSGNVTLNKTRRDLLLRDKDPSVCLVEL